VPSEHTLGLELPPLHATRPAAAGGAVVTVVEAARAAEQAGVGTLWLAGARLGGIDAGPLAGAVAGATERIGIGLVDRPVRGRHPSALARDVTAVDRLSGGRSAVAVLDDGGSVDDVERLVEAAALLRRLFTETDVTVAGRFYEVAELTIRPRPVRPEGPAVLAGLAGPPPTGAHAHAHALVDRAVAGFVTGGGPEEVAASRGWLDATTGPAPAAIVWRGGLPPEATAAERMLLSVLDHGADGVIVVMPERAAVGGAFDRGALEHALVALAGAAARLG
jgi:alkanesulfonate monooxygenase SsuD/methylene tetrahydromethanopterin reductase-like flavin-dependent oxidoreductase (luciferase family)